MFNVFTFPTKHKSAWMNSEIFIDWHSNEFVPNAKEFKKREKKTGKVHLVIDNAPTHLETGTLNAIDEDFKVVFLPPNITALLQPMNQGVIENPKRVVKTSPPLFTTG